MGHLRKLFQRIRNKMWRQSSQQRMIRQSGLFDQGWYRSRYQGTIPAAMDPICYYLKWGAAKGHDPNPVFDSAWYLAQYPDVAAANLNPLCHYVEWGAWEGRNPCALFDSDWYLEQNPDVASAGLNPLAHYLEWGAAEGRNPSPMFDGNWYLAECPDVREARLNPLAHYLACGRAEGRRTRDAKARIVADVIQTRENIIPRTTTAANTPSRSQDILRSRFLALQPMRLYSVPRTPLRVNMVTDSINQGSLYGGVATAMIFSVLLARRLNARLRLVTRTEKADEANLHSILNIHGIDWRDNVDFTFADQADSTHQIDVGERDLFVTTSWWTTHCVREAVDPSRIIYLLQEDERMFYPLDDNHLRCSETLRDPELTFVINSKLLFQHLVAHGLEHITANGYSFEPAFPPRHYYYNDLRQDSKRNFFFYARPLNARNLYYRGLEVLNQAIEAGIFDPCEWEFHFVGKNLEPLILAHGIQPKLLQGLRWEEYMNVVRKMDVGLSLMYTPHPSYPPLDLASSGAVVVTNRYGVKQNLNQYSKNIICTDVSVNQLLDGLARAVCLSKNLSERRENYRQNTFSPSWEQSLDSVISAIAGKLVSAVSVSGPNHDVRNDSSPIRNGVKAA